MTTDGERVVETTSSNERYRATVLEVPGSLKRLSEYWVAEYGGEGDRFTVEQEAQLANIIQAGIKAEKQPEGDETLADELAGTIQAGERAQQALVETNIRFAFYYANISVGKLTKAKLEKFREAGAAWRKENADKPGVSIARYGDNKRGYMGNDWPITALKSPYADLESRKQAAVIAMMAAARTFRTIYTNSEGEEAKGSSFSTYAAYAIQQKIARNARWEEHLVRLPDHKHEDILKYLREHPTEEIDEQMPDDIEQMMRLTERAVFPGSLKSRHEGGIDELNDPWGEDDTAETFADIYADPRQQLEIDVMHTELREKIDNLLDSLSEREAGVIRMRYGIGYDSPKTLDEIGDVFAVTKERIRQIESKTMARLRHPSRSETLRDFLTDIDNVGGMPTDLVRRGDQVKIPEGDASFYKGPRLFGEQVLSQVMKMTPEQWRQREERLAWRREPWQLYLDEPFEIPVRTADVRKQPIEFIDDPDLFKFIFSVIDSADSYHFQRTFAENVGTPYPVGLINRIDAYADGKNLTHGQIASIWDRFMRSGYQRLKKELGDDFSPDRVGQFFSKLIDNHIGSVELNSTLLTLRIPSSEAGKIGYLASYLRAGRIKIIGNPGNFVANNNGGFADIEVIGNVGNSAGAGMHGSAQLTVKGYGGYNIGLGAREDSFIEIDSCKSIGLPGDIEVHVSTNEAPNSAVI